MCKLMDFLPKKSPLRKRTNDVPPPKRGQDSKGSRQKSSSPTIFAGETMSFSGGVILFSFFFFLQFGTQRFACFHFGVVGGRKKMEKNTGEAVALVQN